MPTTFYKATFGGSATAPGTIADTIVGGFGTAGQWTQESATWNNDGASHLTHTNGGSDFADNAFQPGSRLDSGISLWVDPPTGAGPGSGANYGRQYSFVFRRASGDTTQIFVLHIAFGYLNGGDSPVSYGSGFRARSDGVPPGFAFDLPSGNFAAYPGGGDFLPDSVTPYQLRMECVGTGPTTVRMYIIHGTSGAILATASFTDTDKIPLVAGVNGLGGASSAAVSAGSLAGPIPGLWIKQVQIDDGTAYVAPSITPGTVTNTANTASHVDFSATAPSGGTAPYSGQLMRAPDVSGSAGTYANVSGSGATVNPISGTSAYTDVTVSPSTKYWWKVRYSDSVSLTGDSNALTETTPAAALAAGTASVALSTNTQTVVHMTYPSGGTPSYSGQLQRRAHGVGSYANVSGALVSPIPVATVSSYTDNTVVAGTEYDYRVLVTDTASGSAASNALDVPVPSSPPATKPADPTLLSSHPFAATLAWMAPLCETVAGSLPLDIVSRTVMRPQITDYSFQTGLGPEAKAGGYATSAITGPSAKWATSAPAVVCTAAGTGGRNPNAGPVTYAVAWKNGYLTNLNGNLENYSLLKPITGSSFGPNLGLSSNGASDNGNPPATSAKLSFVFTVFQNPNTFSSLTDLDPTHWYAVAVTASTSGTTSLTARCYDLTAGTLVTPLGGTTVTADQVLATPGGQAAFGGALNVSGFRGEKACALIDNESWDDALFANFYTDPWGAARGPAPAGNGGTLTAGDAWAESRDTGIVLHAAFPTGGVNGHSYTYQWLHSQDSSTTVSGWTPLAGATAREWLDTTAAVGSVDYYVCAQTDGTTTVYSPIVFGSRLKGRVIVSFMGTSLIALGINGFGAAGNADGYAVTQINRGRGGSSLGNQWVDFAGHNWTDQLIAELKNSADVAGALPLYCYMQHGTNDGFDPPSGFAANVGLMAAKLAANGIKFVISYPPFRWDSLTNASDQPAMLQHWAALDAAVNGTTVILGEKGRASLLSARFPYRLVSDHLHWADVVAPDVGFWNGFVRNVLEPSSGGGGRGRRGILTGGGL